MPMHYLGDTDFDWNALNQAMNYIDKMHERITGRQPCMKEKYGTIRYEMTFTWLQDRRDVLVFLKILHKAAHKWHHIASEIVDDATVMFDSRHEIDYLIGYISGISYGSKHKSEWLPGPKFKEDQQ